jgi:nucleoside-diphosphate-sugar epimerase
LNIVKRKIPLPLGAIENKRSFVYLGNLVSLIQLCTQHPAVANQVFLVSDGQDLSTTELLQKCANALKVKSRLIPVPQKWIVAIATLLGKKEIAMRLCGNLQVDITKAQKVLGWMPPISVEDGLKATTVGLS